MQFWERIKHHFVPSSGNAYRPHILHRQWLIAFFVVILATEGFLVSNLIVRQSSQNFLAAVVPGDRRHALDLGRAVEVHDDDPAAGSHAYVRLRPLLPPRHDLRRISGGIFLPRFDSRVLPGIVAAVAPAATGAAGRRVAWKNTPASAG